MKLFYRAQYALFLALFLTFGSQIALAWDDPWREVTPAEIQMKASVVEADADAEAIFWEIRIDDSSSDGLSMKHYVRVKIFTERGREKYSKVDIPFVKGRTKLKDISARVIRADGTIVEITDKDIIEREVVRANRVKIRAKSFAVPSIEPGVIVEYRFKEVIEDASAAGMDLEFQKDIPVQKLSYYYKPYNKKDPLFQLYNFKDTRFVKSEKGYYLAERTNIPSFREEPRMPPENMVRPWMELQAVRVNLTGISDTSISFSIKDPGNPNMYWGSVAGERVRRVAWMNQPDKELKKNAEQVVAGAATPEDKLKKLYEFCQSQVKNIAYDTLTPEADKPKLDKIKTLNDVFKIRAGDPYLIDLLFGAMANSLGFETRIAYSGNRSEMFFDPRMTSESFIHRAGIAVKVGEDWKFFNPGLAFLPYGMLIWYEEDVWALLIGERQHSWIKTPMTGHEKTVSKRSGKFKLLEDGTFEGDVQVEHTGQSALLNRLDIYDDAPSKREDEFKDDVKRRVANAEVSAVSIENITDITKPLIYRYKIRVPNYAQKTGKRLFFQPGFFEYGVGPMFSSATRKYDIYFSYPWSERDDIEITLPDGYTLDGAEQPGEFSDPSKIGQLKINIGTDKDVTFMKYSRQFHFGGGGNVLFPSSVYQPLKNLFDEFNKRDAHTIGLKQK